jgi:uncharacterized protein YfdQ (DUF2303 family)
MSAAGQPLELHSAGGDAQAVIDIALEASTGIGLDEGEVRAFVVPAGARVQVVDQEPLLAHPRRAKGTVRLFTPAALVAYVKRHIDTSTTIWADVERRRIAAILNDHEGGGAGPDASSYPGWRDHQALLELRHPPPWRRWMARNGRIGTQQEFAEHIEESLSDIVTPPAAEMLELAQSFQAAKSVAFRTDRRLQSGQVQLTYEETIEAKAGQRGEITIPQTFRVALQPFEGMDLYSVEARLRYRLRDGQLAIGYVLERPEDIVRAAFEEVTGQIGEATGVDVWAGDPFPDE